MNDLIDQIRAASKMGLHHVALFCALGLPDICGAAEASDGEASKARYIAWFDQYVAPKYTTRGTTTLSGEDAYYFRCGLLHQARMKHPRSTYSRILFVEPSTNVFHNNVCNNALNIDVRIFVEDIVSAAQNWLNKMGTDPVVQKNLNDAIQRRPNGLAPYIVGVPVIS